MEEAASYGWLSVLPPAVTIGLAILCRRVVSALLLGIALAVLIQLPAYRGELYGDFLAYLLGSLSRFIVELFEGSLWPQLIDESHLRVFAFTILLGMQVAVIHRCGGMQGIVNMAAPLVGSRRGGQLMTWLLGLVIFIDDYANTLLLGATMRPITDRLRISREKLAFLVDSTAAPVSGLALVSTWVATEISTMQTGYRQAGLELAGGGFGLFVQTIPFRFYVVFMLLFVLLVALLGRDFGPMLRAERRAIEAAPRSPGRQGGEAGHLSDKGKAMYAIVPIGVTLAVVVWLLVATGRAAVGVEQLPPWYAWQQWGQLIGSGDSYLALVYGALAGLVTVVILALSDDAAEPRMVREAALDGAVHVLPALLILWLAWTLSSLTDAEHLATGAFLTGLLQQWEVPVAWMPTIVFVLSAAIAFATGTSWGTMAIVMPMVVPLVYGLIAVQTPGREAVDAPVLVASIGSVLAGAIFGDHCSPISDTTILSSRSSDCDHIAHVRTQMPYALGVGAVSIFCGTLPAGYGVSSWLLLPLGVAVMVGLLLLLGRPLPCGDGQ